MPPSSQATDCWRGWLPALVLSLLLHGGLVLLCWLVPSSVPWGSSDAAGNAPRVRHPQVEVCVITFDTEPPRKQVSKSPVQRAPAPPPVTPKVTQPQPAAAATPSVVVRAPGENEESELAVGSSSSPGALGMPNGSGHGGTTSFFDIQTTGQAIVYVIDCSASMGQHDALNRARAELLASLKQLPATARFQVIAYNSRAETLPLDGQGGLVPANAVNKHRAAALIEKLEAEGATRHVPALKCALALQPEVIFFLTDGDDLKAEEIRELTLFNHGRSVIHAIGLLGADRGGSGLSLQQLAAANHGKAWVVRH